MSILNPEIKSSGRESVPKVSALYAHAFETDPLITYILHNMSQPKRISYLPAWFDVLLTQLALNSAIFTEIDDFKSCATIMLPGKKADNIFTIFQAGLIGIMWNSGFGPCWRMVVEFSSLTDKCKVKGLLGQKKYYYISSRRRTPQLEVKDSVSS